MSDFYTTTKHMVASWQSSGESYRGVKCCWNVDTHHPPGPGNRSQEWLQDLITGSCFAQLLVSPPLIQHDCSETQNHSLIVAYRPCTHPYTVARDLWERECVDSLCGSACARRICPLLPSLPFPLSLYSVLTESNIPAYNQLPVTHE